MTFGEKVRELRLAKGINQRDLAERVDIDVTYLSKIENNRMPPPSHDTIQRIASELDADADALLVLADKVPEDLKPIITKSSAHPDFFRSMQDLSEEELRQVQKYADELRKQRGN